MIIYPSGLVQLFTTVPLEKNTRKSIKFANISEQNTYFNGKVKYQYSNVSYVRTEKGIKIEAEYDNIMCVSYMRFQNTGFSSKWVYAFVDNIRYVSNNVYELSFTIDELQTWLFDYDIAEGLIERETVASDVIGEHLIDEGIAVDNVIMEMIEHNYKLQESTRLIIEFTPSTELYIAGKIANIPQIEAGVIGKVYTGSSYKTFLMSETNEIENFINLLLASGNEITNMYMCPADFFAEEQKSQWLPNVNIPSSFNGYKPRNNKLFTYPFTYITVVGTNEENYRFEKMRNQTIGFEQNACIVPSVAVSMIPLYYNGIEYNYSRAVELRGFPVSSWLDNGIRISSVLKDMMSSTKIKTTTDENDEKTHEVTTDKPSWKQSSKVHGNMSADIAWSNDYMGYKLYVHGITSETAKAVDDYFTQNGYKVDVIKKPTRNREKYDFVKTRNCSVVGEIPTSAKNYIKEMYDHGITLWYNASDYGNYNVENGVVK